ncbi:MAG: hypothetical protein AAB766_00950 [Patescibacteria group bacterium]
MPRESFQPSEQPAAPEREQEIIDTTGDERIEKPDLKLVNLKAQEYREVAGKYAARADILFQENQNRAKALGQKKWDKESAYYKQWNRTTKIVSLAEKIADFYDENGDVETELAKFNARSGDKSLTADEKLTAVDKAFELQSKVDKLKAMKEDLANHYRAMKLHKKMAAEEPTTENLPLKKRLEEVEQKLAEKENGFKGFFKFMNPAYGKLVRERDELRKTLGIDEPKPTFAAKE